MAVRNALIVWSLSLLFFHGCHVTAFAENEGVSVVEYGVGS
jgi:hypothetical protein